MKKRTMLLCLCLVLSLAMAAGGTLAYLSDTDADVNVMTLGSVKINQLEYERVVDQSGAWVSTGNTDKYGYTPDKIQSFTQGKPLYPAVFADGSIKWDDRVNGHQQSWGGVEGKKVTGAPGSCFLLDDSVKNALDKFVFVENTGKSPAYVRTWFAFEQGDLSDEEFSKMILTNGDTDHWDWETVDTGVEITGTDGTTSKYVIACATYLGPKSNPTGILEAGTITYPSLLQVYMHPTATNADVEAVDGNGNGTYDILVLSQAIQTAGFENASDALNEGFGTEPPKFPTEVVEETPSKIWEDVTPDKTISAASITDSGLTLENGKVVEISDLNKPVKVEGNGTVIVEDGNVVAGAEESGITIAPGSNVTLIIKGETTLTGGTGADGITVGEGAKVVITGPGKLIAEGNGGKDDESNSTSGHGIGGAGTIVIKDLEDLDARGHGKEGTGIGGNSTSITIESTHISNVSGGRAQIYYPESSNYYKDAPEGSPAIGSLEPEAEINLTEVVIDNAIGGSKAAGIGARFWCSATINITNCEIKNAVGGNSSAGIGGSRPGSECTGKYVKINIHDSTITAFGGVQAAGIGSGYDTYCHNVDIAYQTTINITGNSVINATGGKFGAGIGTGYHSGHLAGKIEDSVTVNAVGDTIHYKDSDGDDGVYTYTLAMDVGFGMIDLNREGKYTDGRVNDCTFYYNGAYITIPEAFIPPTT